MKNAEFIEKWKPYNLDPYLGDIAFKSDLDMLLEEMCREQRIACHRNYKTKQAENIAEKVREANSVNYEGKHHDLGKSILTTPLITEQ